jgi:hypothetical protein
MNFLTSIWRNDSSLKQTFLFVHVKRCRGETMKRTIMVVLVVGFLILGAFAGIENVLDRISFHQNTDFSDSGEVEDFPGPEYGNTGGFSTLTGGHQGGAGDVPG